MQNLFNRGQLRYYFDKLKIIKH